MIVKRDRGGEGLGRSFTSRLMRPRGYIRGRRQIETYESRGAEEARERNFVMREYERKRAEHPQHPYHWRINVHPAIVHLRLISSRRLTVRRGSYRGHANVANNENSLNLCVGAKVRGTRKDLCAILLARTRGRVAWTLAEVEKRKERGGRVRAISFQSDLCVISSRKASLFSQQPLSLTRPDILPRRFFLYPR